MSLQWSALFGGLGLFLWGMHMLSQGLRLAAGARLEMVLARATDTRFRGLVSGAVTTAIVQSSSAVTVATIGFVNASLLTLGSALWVLFGANLGTTATGWIVAIAGLKVDFSVLALPLIALGAGLKLFGEKRRLAAWGEAVAGFGLLFYGIVLMQSGFSDLSANWQIPQVDGFVGMALQALVGVAMTVVMQSSSASTAIALTAAQSGLIDVTGAAAVVIGANIGTTVTAVLASLGATPNAKRVAAAHVLFNIITAIAAFVVLPWLIPAIVTAIAWLGGGQAPGTTLAIFNTLFNALGILLIWPLVPAMTRWLRGHFAGDVSAGAKPRFLDQTTLPVPGLAVRALASELSRMLELARESIGLALAVQSAGQESTHDLRRAEQAKHDLKRLLVASEEFVEQMNRAEMDADSGERLAHLLRVRRYLENVVEGEAEVAALSDAVSDVAHVPSVNAAHETYLAALRAWLSAMAPTQEGEAVDRDVANEYETAYQAFKQAMLQAGAAGSWRLERMERALRRASTERRMMQQLAKAQRWLVRAQISNS